MSTKTVVLRASASQGVGTAAAEPNYIGADAFFGAVIEIEYESGTGTLDVWVQRELPSGAFEDLARITQLTTAGKRAISWIAAGEEEYAPTDAALAAGQIRNGPLGKTWRLKSTVGTATVTWKSTAGLYL